ncbi:Glutamine-dependent NAD(+) synthetase [Bienertia sinuspersici]
MPVIRGSERYSCQVLCMNRKIIMIRPKTCLANDGNYRELRWFTAWKQKDQMVEFQLPPTIADDISQNTVPFGFGFIQFLDTAIAGEMFEELYSSVTPHSQLALNGVEVFMSASGSHHQLRKLDVRMDAFKTATKYRGGVYIYSNQQGCDGGRLYYDGCCCVVMNGDVVAQGSQFSLKDVEVVVAHVNLGCSKLLALGFLQVVFKNRQAAKQSPSVVAPYKLCRSFHLGKPISHPLKLSVAAIVGCMCQLVVKEIENGNEQVKTDALRIGQYHNGQYPTDSKEFAKRIFCTVFMGTENRSRSKVLADEIGSWHLDVCIDALISGLLTLFQTLTGKRPRYKYDCSSGDLNPIGSINKTDLRAFLRWAAVHLGYPSLAAVEAAPLLVSWSLHAVIVPR